ncbi:16S rRNA (uracil1498-N3)-methyltransferase [Algoriphagus ratkowskyi]|uniref:Ribosomal RNA small subunit methyltransferase E n=1 Tax=Algoriphagus ratkowskyi TaxID=57028 RepID=A0A2W7QRP3_9BACT|nr:RsmE family RNA methyltransferase [Algoriphagus ratkowskyi]PZX50641.1 16S rRNA (uracil1498-N3)-methyltransferase [Algoriphagus ratkowskyi]TXD80000.1 16S rRNA (uracil(1498)-N(3))-methyltransferase [Algoriphagus ratkowskyi]
MQLFFQENSKPPLINLEADESKHLCRVLRKKQGDKVFVTNGDGSLYECVILEANPKKTSLKVIHTTEVPEENFHIHLAIAPTKSPDRMEWMVEKITEIGFHELTLLETMNSERSYLKTDRLEKKMISACKQSLKYRIPSLHPISKLDEILDSKDFEDYQKFIAYVDENHDHHLFDIAIPNEKYLILIGPEGDFDPIEIQKAFDAGFKPVSLGNARLRTETAGLAAIQMLQTLNR